MPKIPAALRPKIIEALLTSSERKSLYAPIKKKIEEVVSHPAVGKAYIGGSFASKKTAPSDIDLFVRHAKGVATPEGEDFFGKFQPYLADPLMGRGTGKEGLHIIEGWPKKKSMWGDWDDPPTSWNSEIREAKKRYGKDYKLVRILSLLAALASGQDKKEEGE